MMSFVHLILFKLCLNVINIDSARILAVFPTPSLSHQIVFRKVTEELVRRGHEVTVITTDPIYSAGESPMTLKEIDVHDMSYNIWNDDIVQVPAENKNDFYNNIDIIMRSISKVIKIQLTTNEIQDIVNKKNGDYDLLILEAWVRPILIFSHIYNVPVLQISSFGALNFNWKNADTVTHPLLYPIMVSRKVYTLSMWEKLQELYDNLIISLNFYIVEKKYDEVLKNIIGPDTPKISDVSGNINMLLMNYRPIWVENQPVSINIVSMGGIHLNNPKSLPKDLKAVLDDSNNGVIFFSLGTNVIPSNLPLNIIEIFIKVFSQLPYKVIWKWDKDVLPGITSNINIFKWLPQSDLLRHPNVKLFITQGGLQSTDEAIDAGVPMIGIPMLGDQWYNVAKYVRHKIGIGLNLETLTEDEFRNAIMTVINDNSYRDNIIRLRSLLEDQPQSPLERAVWWTEYLLRHGGATQLRAPAANITWMEYFELELLASVFLVLICVLCLVIAGAYVTFNLLRNYIAKTKANMD